MLYVCLSCVASEDVDPDVERGARLTGGPTRLEGVVEIYMDGRWFLVCDDWFDEDDGAVICRMIGAAEGVPTLFTSSSKDVEKNFDEIRGIFNINYLACTGAETRISECDQTNGGIRCNLPEQVGLKCLTESEARQRIAAAQTTTQTTTTTPTTSTTTAVPTTTTMSATSTELQTNTTTTTANTTTTPTSMILLHYFTD